MNNQFIRWAEWATWQRDEPGVGWPLSIMRLAFWLDGITAIPKIIGWFQ